MFKVKSKGKDVTHRDKVEAVNSDTNDLRLDLQIEFGNVAIRMKKT